MIDNLMVTKWDAEVTMEGLRGSDDQRGDAVFVFLSLVAIGEFEKGESKG